MENPLGSPISQYAADEDHPYVRANHGTSKEPGMVTLTQYINGHIPGVTAEHLPHGCCFRLEPKRQPYFKEDWLHASLCDHILTLPRIAETQTHMQNKSLDSLNRCRFISADETMSHAWLEGL